MRVGSLFSGIGGMDLGLERAGMEIKWQVEIDEYCRRVLAKHWPNVPRYGDIRELDGRELEPVDLICGGFPCQPVSYAGKGLAQEDERWLWPEFQRLLGVVRPRFVIIENVPGLYDRGLGDVLAGLAALRFDAEWTHLSAAEAGAPHLRERVFIVAYADSERFGGGVLFNGGYDFPNYEAWGAAKGVESWDGWKRWLNAIREAGFDPDAHGFGLEADSDDPLLRLQAVDTGYSGHGGTVVREGGVQYSAESGAVRSSPVLLRVDDGLPNRVDRIKALGNAVVPQVVEYIGTQLLSHLPSAGKRE